MFHLRSRETAHICPRSKYVPDRFLEVGVVVTVDLFEHLQRHPQEARSLPHVKTGLHEPRRRCVA